VSSIPLVAYTEGANDAVPNQAREIMRAGVVPTEKLAATLALTIGPCMAGKPGVIPSRYPQLATAMVREKVMISKRMPSGFENVNSSLPLKAKRSFSFATRFKHQAQSQSPSTSYATTAARFSLSGCAMAGTSSATPLEACQFTRIIYPHLLHMGTKTHLSPLRCWHGKEKKKQRW